MQLFFNSTISSQDTEIQFSKEESRHIIKVLRKTLDDDLFITNGKGYLFKAKITLAGINKCIASITETEYQDKEKHHIHLAVAPTKMNDRYEWFLEKATEIGIQEITPIICDHSERKAIKFERFQKIIQSATKQSLRYHIPKLNNATTLKDFITNHKNETCLIAHCEETKRTSLKQILSNTESLNFTLLIGPEGDFSTKEIDLALTNNYQPITLGNTRLRTETAAIVATHSIVYSLE
ncbi:16S rRNA (uracil(1498)-N(3))-methyltransferase [Aquimarina agarilytica]|uniref:16S rRNA (uracil(1498)-N(3))-methyltransferase n=1 Tax=Aquimarina agarilytica TaxID=1087449 RepID=UPI000288E243|nr:16S rRNA (uracil(1498)-N(3))-methyltransferase [Aquimarina agarilytica]